jgi:hypothetical protein
MNVDPSPARQPILTLEPLLEAVREGLEAAGWGLSGLQKTTSYEFEGRWAGEASRSAYLFFHRDDGPEWASIDVFLDETSQGLRGNLALVLDGRELAHLADPAGVLAKLAALARPLLPRGHRVPLTLRYRLEGLDADPGAAETEARLKIHITRAAMEAGPAAVAGLAAATARDFGVILSVPELAEFAPPDPSSDPAGGGGR